MRVVYSDSETGQDEVMDSEQSGLEEQMPSARPVHVPDKENTETDVEPSVKESLTVRQQSDPDLGKLIRFRLQSAEQPALALLSTESESAKRLYNQWERLKVREGLVRRTVEENPGEQPYSQLLVPRQSVQDVLRSCHEGMTGGHFGIRRTLDQVKRRFYCSLGKKTRFVSVSDASLATNIIVVSSDEPDRYSPLLLALRTSGGIST